MSRHAESLLKHVNKYSPRLTETARLRRALLVVTLVFLILLPIISAIRPWALGWSSVNLHENMTLDALSGLGWTDEQIDDIPDWACYPDYPWAPGYNEYYHRTWANQDEFLAHYFRREEINLTMDRNGGAEDAAAFYVGLAHDAHEAGDVSGGRMMLGYAIHYIQDALCPPHVFPFSEHLGDGLPLAPHTNFEVHTEVYYYDRLFEWRNPVLKATPFKILNPTHLKDMILSMVALVEKLECEYKGEDGEFYGTPPLSGWWMSEWDIGFCMGIASSLVKGAARWATEGEWAPDLYVEESGPGYVEQGSRMTRTISYVNFEAGDAKQVVITSTLSPEVTFVSASNEGEYDETSHSVTWAIGDLAGGAYGSVRVTVLIPDSVPVGTVLENVVEISSLSAEYNVYNNLWLNKVVVLLRVSEVPTNIEITPIVAFSAGIPVVDGLNPVWFTYYDVPDAETVEMRVGLSDGGPLIVIPMSRIGETDDWQAIRIFFPRFGAGTVVYSLHLSNGQTISVSHRIFVRGLADPSGYVYDALSGERLSAATITLLRFEETSHQFVFVHPEDLGIDPNVNPQTTDLIGEYKWMVSPGLYKVVAQKGGYEPNCVIVSIPPPAMDLDISLTPIDVTPPETTLSFTMPNYINSTGSIFVSSNTRLILSAEDADPGTGVSSTDYRICNSIYQTEWLKYTDSFCLEQLSDGSYSIEYTSSDHAGNVEPTKSAPVVLDNTLPSTSLTIGEPKYAGTTYVTPQTPFTMTATDMGSGVQSIFFRINNDTYSSGWIIYTEPFCLTGDGNYTITYYSIDNLGNRELEQSITLTLFSWTSEFGDSYGRNTVLKVNTQYKLFQFSAPSKDFGIKRDSRMIAIRGVIAINYKDSEMQLMAACADGKLTLCIATAWDRQTGKQYSLIEKIVFHRYLC